MEVNGRMKAERGGTLYRKNTWNRREERKMSEGKSMTGGWKTEGWKKERKKRAGMREPRLVK